VLVASYVINGVNAGIYGPNALFAVMLALVVIMIDILVAPVGSAAAQSIEEGVV